MFELPDKHQGAEEPWFPDPQYADEEGLLSIGGSLAPNWLLHAYNRGIFPWYSEGQPILWWSPDPRMVVTPEQVHVSKSMKRFMVKTHLRVTFNQDFSGVIAHCQKSPRPHQEGTWITEAIKSAYTELHQMGRAVSVEVWDKQQLVGGLYGVDLKAKGVFCGESMFSKHSNASKLAFIALSRKLSQEKYRLIDCQMHTLHLESLGAYEISRSKFLTYLQ